MYLDCTLPDSSSASCCFVSKSFDTRSTLVWALGTGNRVFKSLFHPHPTLSIFIVCEWLLRNEKRNDIRWRRRLAFFLLLAPPAIKKRSNRRQGGGITVPPRYSALWGALSTIFSCLAIIILSEASQRNLAHTALTLAQWHWPSKIYLRHNCGLNVLDFQARRGRGHGFAYGVLTGGNIQFEQRQKIKRTTELSQFIRHLF